MCPVYGVMHVCQVSYAIDARDTVYAPCVRVYVSCMYRMYAYVSFVTQHVRQVYVCI